mgnify:CR=1 FL=1
MPSPSDFISIPFATWVNLFVREWLVPNFRPFFRSMQWPITQVLNALSGFLNATPMLVFTLALALIAWRTAGRGVALFTLVALSFIDMIGLWPETMTTLAMVVTAVLFCVVIGIPLGIYAGLRPRAPVSRAIMGFSILGFSLPTFWIGLMMITAFSVYLGWLPSSGRGRTVEVLGIPVSFLTRDGLAHLALPAAFRADLDTGFVLHPALMDLATGWAMGLIEGYGAKALWVPVSYGSVTVFAPLPAEIISHVRIKPAEPGFASFDITLAAPDGTVCAEIRRFTIKRLEQGFGAPAPLLPSELAFDETPGEGRALSRAEERLARNLAQGITPAEGAEAFVRALSLETPQVVISSLTLPELIAEAAEAPVPEAGEGQKFERPDLGSDYVAPRNDIERMLVGFWEDLLGVKGVGVEDSFFDLGGHSLIAVRLFAKVKKAWAVDFPISVLFEAPTIAKSAAMIAERTGYTEAGAAPATPTRRYEFLVPMHEGEGGEKTPFFLVAGMFGNVLNLRHLASLLGADRPFYGLQARGLLGDKPPHETLKDAARDYLAEVRQVQPHGPYLLGGFSGGGLTALEMAWALQEAGEEVALLVMLDTPLPLRPELSKQDKALIKLAELRRKGPGYLLEWWQAKRDWKEAQRRMSGESDGESGFHNRAIETAFRNALPHVQLRPYTGRTALFRPPLDRHWKVSDGRWVSQAREYVLPDNDWSRWMPELSVHEVPGDHDSMVLEPNVRVMAARMRELIRTAEGTI